MNACVRFWVGITSVCAILLVGCTNEAFIPENILTKALETDENISYYGELSAKFGGVEGLEDVSMKEWRQGSLSRVEVSGSDLNATAVKNSESLTFYDESEQTAYFTEDDAFQALYMNPREELDMVLDLVKDTHDTENVGEEEIAGRPAVHLKLSKQKGKKSLLGDQELWIDKENWMVLKMISTSGNTRNEVTYDSIEFDVTHESSVFELDLPEDVVMKDFDEIGGDMVDEKIELDEVTSRFGEHVLYFPNNSKYEMDTITYLEMKSDKPYQDVTIDYNQTDGTPLFTFTILKKEDQDKDEWQEELGEAVEMDKVRGQEAMMTDTKEFRFISWSEEDYEYNITLIAPDLTWEDMKEWTKEMEEIK